MGQQIDGEDEDIIWGTPEHPYEYLGGISAPTTTAHAPRVWYCEYCDSGNMPSQDVCCNCGAPRTREPDVDCDEFTPDANSANAIWL